MRAEQIIAKRMYGQDLMLIFNSLWVGLCARFTPSSTPISDADDVVLLVLVTPSFPEGPSSFGMTEYGRPLCSETFTASEYFTGKIKDGTHLDTR